MRNSLKWADGQRVKREVELAQLDLLGPKTEADLAPPPKAEKIAKQPKPAKAPATEKGIIFYGFSHRQMYSIGVVVQLKMAIVQLLWQN